jgi:hypothetical protein
MTHALNAASIDLLEFRNGTMRMQDSRVNPLLVLDLCDDGLVEVDSQRASLSLAAKGRCFI